MQTKQQDLLELKGDFKMNGHLDSYLNEKDIVLNT